MAGGTGGAALAAGIQQVAPEHELTVIANTADDDEFWGLLVCPDIDAVLYRLAGVFNDAAGYGVRDDTFSVLEALSRAGEDTWFRVGDKDFATHLVRTELLHQGRSLTQATLELCKRFGVSARVLPMTDDVMRTRFATDQGELSFQEYFVREHLKPTLRGIKFATPEPPHATPEVLAALDGSDLVLIGPSNPLISIDPILKLTRQRLPRAKTWAVTPIVAGASLKGPTVDMMRALGQNPSPYEVARRYCDIASVFVLDQRDADLKAAIEGLRYRVIVTDTVMRDGGHALAAAVLRDV
ncbi:MAG TPA: 2-phospho-L-lactate transferase [Candidatus Dormibacteraeota bacterium]|nr:2-phospho-L-lactate transferase [Candidatus Dormibacteraeota bacterium]